MEVLSGDKEERVELMVLLVKNLLKENKELRGMIKGMAGFVGEGEYLVEMIPFNRVIANTQVSAHAYPDSDFQRLSLTLSSVEQTLIPPTKPL